MLFDKPRCHEKHKAQFRSYYLACSLLHFYRPGAQGRWLTDLQEVARQCLASQLPTSGGCDIVGFILDYFGGFEGTISHELGAPVKPGDEHIFQFNYPFSITVDGDTIFVLEYDNRRVQVIGAIDRELKFTFDSLLGDRSFNFTTGSMAASDEHLFIADKHNACVRVFDKLTGEDIGTINVVHEDHTILIPNGLAVHCQHLLVSTDDCICVINTESMLVERKLGSKGTGDGMFDGPTGIVLKSNRLYVCDWGNNRIQVWTYPEGKFLGAFGQRGWGDGEFNCPLRIAVSDSSIFVSDLSCSVHEFLTMDWSFVRSWDVSARSHACGLAFHSGLLFVADRGGNKIRVFR